MTVNTAIKPEELEGYAALLEGTGAYRVLRRVPKPPTQRSTLTENERTALILDVETTGLDPQTDEVIEIGTIEAIYTLEGQITKVNSYFSQLRQPSIALPDNVIDLTGITREMLRGKRIDLRQLTDLASRASIVIAHNAAFDRPFCEKLLPAFRDKPWACSATEIPWKSLGLTGTKLVYLLNSAGWFYDAHRAVDDCLALLQLLQWRPPRTQTTTFQILLEEARGTTVRISFVAPYSRRAELRRRGFKWRTSQHSRQGHWAIEVKKGAEKDTLSYLSGLNDVPAQSIKVEELTARDRFRPDEA